MAIGLHKNSLLDNRNDLKENYPKNPVILQYFGHIFYSLLYLSKVSKIVYITQVI